MHSYLKSVGFSKIETKEQEEKLLAEIIRYANRKSMISVSQENDRQYVEFSCDVAQGIGVTIRGQMDEDDKLHVDHYFPYLIPRNVTSQEDLYISKKSDNDSYGALCEDFRVGVSLIFHVQNAVDYLRTVRNPSPDTPLNYPVKLSALALEGTILFPTKKTAEDVKQFNDETKKYARMIADAKKGNQEAIEHLTIKEYDTFSSVNNRVKNEDVFSIVDTSFAPYGMESEVYRILGIIMSLEERVNSFTDEKMYVMEVYCNHIVFDLCVNESDLLGVPEKGRRFRGIVWLQGRVEFDA